MSSLRGLQIFVLAAAVLMGSACGGGNAERPAATRTPLPSNTSASVSTSVTTPQPSANQPAPNNKPPANQPAPGNKPPANQPPADQPPPGNPGQGTAFVRTRTLSGAPVPNVAVVLRQVQPCNPATKDIPPGSTELQRRDGVTDADGLATFLVPVGCYYFGLNKEKLPVDPTPVPEGLHSLFLVNDGDVTSGTLRFNEPAPSALCDPKKVVNELDNVYEHLRGLKADVTDCDGKWAFISWPAALGDNARIIRRGGDRWSTYVAFPHDVCRAKAVADGVPEQLQKNFPAC
ncbi:hypothetical protein [Nocardia sp. NPDC049149]|uniref:hypothetical protein n=1 Tax=Nocardia sp. NPDC049149 TaxID=3364315 RepID=UPI00371DC17D